MAWLATRNSERLQMAAFCHKLLWYGLKHSCGYRFKLMKNKKLEKSKEHMLEEFSLFNVKEISLEKKTGETVIEKYAVFILNRKKITKPGA